MEVYCWSLNYFAIFMDTCLYQFCSLRIYLRFSGSGLVLSDIFTPFTDISHFLALLRYGWISKEVGQLGGKNLFHNMYVLRNLHTIDCFNCWCLHVCVYACMCTCVWETDRQTNRHNKMKRRRDIGISCYWTRWQLSWERKAETEEGRIQDICI